MYISIIMPDISEIKNALRKRFAEERANLSFDDMNQKSEEILNYLSSLPEYNDSATIYTFIGSLPGEIQTIMLAARALSEDKAIIVPVYHGNEAPPSHSILRSINALEFSPFGIMQPSPQNDIPVPISDSDLIIAPCLAADRDGNRLGMGGGFYDKILAEVNVPVIVIAYDFQIVKNLPTESHDMKFDILITESGVKRVSE